MASTDECTSTSNGLPGQWVPKFAPLYAIWPLVLCAAHGGGDGRKGVYLELGANDGVTSSNTLYIERCLRWRGVLVEGNEILFSRLEQQRSNRSNVLVHAAASSNCSADGTISFSASPSELAGISDVVQHNLATHHNLQHTTKPWNTVRVPCRPLRVTLESALQTLGAPQIDLASIDTEGSGE